jgi:hypothetical protein
MESSQSATIIEVFVLLYFQLLTSFLFCEFKRKITFVIISKKKNYTSSVKVDKDCYNIFIVN